MREGHVAVQSQNYKVGGVGRASGRNLSDTRRTSWRGNIKQRWGGVTRRMRCRASSWWRVSTQRCRGDARLWRGIV